MATQETTQLKPESFNDLAQKLREAINTETPSPSALLLGLIDTQTAGLKTVRDATVLYSTLNELARSASQKVESVDPAASKKLAEMALGYSLAIENLAPKQALVPTAGQELLVSKPRRSTSSRPPMTSGKR